MTQGKQIFQAVCDAPDLELAIAELSLADWRTLFAFLEKGGELNGVSGHVLGLMFLDAAERIKRGGKSA